MIKYFPNEHTSARNLQQELLALLTVLSLSRIPERLS